MRPLSRKKRPKVEKDSATPVPRKESPIMPKVERNSPSPTQPTYLEEIPETKPIFNKKLPKPKVEKDSPTKDAELPNQIKDPESTILRSVLQFVTGENRSVCRLCIAPTNHEEVSLWVCVTVQASSCNETITFMDMLRELGVPNEPLMPQSICTNCATNTINSYLYQKQWQHSTEKWQTILDKLAKSLDQSEASNLNKDAAFLMVNKNENDYEDDSENFVVTSFREKPVMNKTLALQKLRTLLKNKKKYVKRVRTPKHRQIPPSSDQDVMCVECGAMCTSKRDLLNHSLRKHKDSTQHPSDVYSCKQCTKVFAVPSQLDTHVAKVHLPKTIRCPECPKMFSSKKLLIVHSRMRHQSHRCKHCDAVLNNYPALTRHMETHKINKCPRCDKVLKNKHTVTQHLKICGKDRSESLPTVFCDMCNKGYNKKNSLRQHIKKEHGYGQVYTCMWCDKKFAAPSSLKAHTVKHTRERNFCCDQCGGKFVNQNALTYHLRLHTGEKPYACKVCGETFINTSRRAAHMQRKHGAPQSFECPVCKATFAFKASVNRHMKRHKNPKSKMYLG